jgi:hypothetical protein
MQQHPQEQLLMTRRSPVWLVAAALFLVINVAGAGSAAADGEPLHTGIHAGLALLGAYLAWRLASRGDARRGWRRDGAEIPAVPGALTDRLTHIEQSVDAIALEVERIGEGQRFMTRLFAENGPPPGVGSTAPTEREAQEPPEAAPPVRRS